jgi:hypothetical protein
MKVAHVTGEVERDDLALAVAHLIESRGQPFADEARLGDRLARRHNIGSRTNLIDLVRDVEDRLLLFRLKARPPQQPSEEHLQCRMGWVHASHAPSHGGALRLLGGAAGPAKLIASGYAAAGWGDRPDRT